MADSEKTDDSAASFKLILEGDGVTTRHRAHRENSDCAAGLTIDLDADVLCGDAKTERAPLATVSCVARKAT